MYEVQVIYSQQVTQNNTPTDLPCRDPSTRKLPLNGHQPESQFGVFSVRAYRSRISRVRVLLLCVELSRCRMLYPFLS